MKAKRKLYSGHEVMLAQSPSADDFRNDGNNNTCKLPVKEGCNLTSKPPTGRKKNEGRLSRKSSMKRKLLQCSSLSLQRGMRNDGGDASELMQRSKSDRCGPSSKSSIESTNANKRKEGDKNVGVTQTLQGNLLESEASDYDFSLLCEVASPKKAQNCRHNSTGSDTSGCSINEDWVTGADKDAGLKDHVQSTEAAEQLPGLQNQPDVTATLETQEMFITQKDTKPKPNKGLSYPFGASRILKAKGNPRRTRPANKQHRTVSQVKQLKRSTITQAVMIRHSSCPQQFLSSPFSQYQNKGGARAKLCLRKVKELQEKRRIVDSQISTLAESQGDSQLASSGELSVSPQDLETQEMFITQKDTKPKPNKGLSHPFGASRILKAKGNPRRTRPANKQHRTVSQVKQLKRSTITQAVMIRHSSCPQQFLISPFSQYQNKGGARAKLCLRKVKELQEKRRIVDSQISTLAESQGDSQLASSGELSVSPQDLETQEMFITQKDTKPKPNKGFSHPFGLSRILKAKGNPRRTRPANKQHRTVSQVKHLKRSTITQAVMIRHSSCPQQFLSSPFSQYQNKGGSRAKLCLRKVKELQEKRRIVDSQISTLAESQGDSQLASSGELSVSPQDLGCGTQMFNVSSEDQEPVVTDSQSVIPPMVADDDSEQDTFKEVLSMRPESRKRQRRHKNRSIFGWSPLEEGQEEETGDPVCDEERSEEGEGDKDISTRSPADILEKNVPSEEREPLVNVSESDEETVKNETISEFSTSQSTVGKREGDLFKEPTLKQGIGSVAKEDVDIGRSDTYREDGSSVTPTSDTTDCNPTDNARHLVGEDVVGVWIPSEEGDTSKTKENDEISAAKSKKRNEEVPRMKDLIVLETQSERTEPGNDGETVTQQPEVTIVPDSHDMTQSSLPRYHFTSDEETSDELHDESVTEAVSNFLNTFEDSGDEKPPWKETEGQLRRDGASIEKKDHTEENLKGKESEWAKDSRQHIASLSKSDCNSSKTLDESIDISLAEEGGDQLVDDFVNLVERGPVTRKKAEKMNIKIGDSVVSDTSGVSQGVMKKLSHCLSLSVDRKRSVRTEKDRDSNLLKKGSKLHEGSSVIPVRADVHVPDIPMAIAEVNEGTDSITSPLKKNSTSANSSQSRNNERVECPVEILIAGTRRESTVNAGNDSADLGNSSRETCLPDDDNVGSDAERLSSGSSCDEDGELGERKMFVGEVSPSVDTVGKVTSPFSAIGGGTLESSIVGLAGPSRGEYERCNRTNLRATSAQTDITLQDLQSQEYFDFCIELKRLLVEYDKSVMVLVRRVADSRVRDKTLASEEAASDRLKPRKRKRKMVDSSCQIRSPSKDLEKSTSTILSPKTSSPKEDLWDRWTDQSIDVEETGGLNDKHINASENPVFGLDVDVSSSPENPAAENSSEGKKRKVEQGKIKKRKKRKKNHAAENSFEGGKEQLEKHKSKKGKKNDRDKVRNAEKKKSNRVAENLVEGKNGKLEEGKTKKRKKTKKNHAAENFLEGGREQLKEQKTEKGKKNDGDSQGKAKKRKKEHRAAENSVEGRNGKLEEGKTKKGKKNNEMKYLGKTKKKKKSKNSKETFSLFDIPIESLPSPEELRRQRKEKKRGGKTLGVSNKRNNLSFFDIPVESLPSPDELKRQRKEKKFHKETLQVSSKRNMKKRKKSRKQTKMVKEVKVSKEQVVSSDFDSTQGVTDLEMGYSKKKTKMKKKRKYPEKVKASKQKLLNNHGGSSDKQGNPERWKEETESGKRKEVNKHKKKKILTGDDEGDLASKVLLQEKSAALTSGTAVTMP